MLWLLALPTLIVVNARVWTGTAWTEAVAVSGERILATGTSGEMRALAAPGATILDALGDYLTAGFNDAHFHLPDPPLGHVPLPLAGMKTRAEMLRRISVYAANVAPGEWVVGEGWTNVAPSREELDRAAPRNPVSLVHRDGDRVVANTLAVRAAGGDGLDALELARLPGAYVRRLEASLAALPSLGLTSIQHIGSWQQLLALRRVKLPVRVYASVPLKHWRRLRDLVEREGRGDEWLHWGLLKGWANQWRGEEEWSGHIQGATAAGLQVAMHVGDERVLHGLLSIMARVDSPGSRFRLEHVNGLPLDTVAEMARRKAMASVQPTLLAEPGKPKLLFAGRELLEAGVRVAFGTDSGSSGATPPLAVMKIALERPGPDGRRISLEQAIDAYTYGSAYAEFAEERKGRLTPGSLADFVVFDRGLGAIRLTVIGGRIAYQEPKAAMSAASGAR